jgi:hypothetical protein
MCQLTELAARRRPVDFGRYDRLHHDGKHLIRGWLSERPS